jgi:hypothetical protein
MLLEIMGREQQAAPAPKVRPPGVLRLSRSGMMKAKAERDEIKQIADRLKVGAPALSEAHPRALEHQSAVGGMEQEGGQSVMQCTGQHCVREEGESVGQGGGESREGEEVMEIGCGGGWRLPRASRLSHSHRSRVAEILASGPCAFWTQHPSQGKVIYKNSFN